MGKELGEVDIIDGSKHENTLIFVHELSLEVTRSSEYRLDSTHTVIIMLLRGKLL